MSDKVWWEYYCKLFPSNKTTNIDPTEHRCDCGYRWHFNILDKVRMLIHGGIVFTCPQCQYKRKYKLMHHVVRDVTDEKDLIDKNKGLIRYGYE